MFYFSPENSLVIAACSPAPDSARLAQTIASIENWEKACAKLIKKGVAPLFLEIAENNAELISLLPAEVIAKLRQAYLKTVSRSMLLYDAFGEIAAALNKAGIQAVALKGIYLAEHLYPKIGLRQFSDIDLLFRHEEVEKALEVFYQLGFSMVKPAFGEAVTSVIESAHLPPLTRRGVSVELHTRLHGPTQPYLLPEREMAERAERVLIHHQPFLAFGTTDLLIHLCLHLDKHFNGSHMQFYSWADIARLVALRGHEIDGAQLWQRCRDYKAEKEVAKVLAMVQGLFEVQLPAEWKSQGVQLPEKESLKEVKQPEAWSSPTAKRSEAWSSPTVELPGTESLKKWPKKESASDATFPIVPTNELSPAALQQLERHLDDKVSHESGTQTHLFFIRKIKSPLGKLRYLREVLLPGKRLMLRSYPIKNEGLYWLWYPYRAWVGLKGFFWKRK